MDDEEMMSCDSSETAIYSDSLVMDMINFLMNINYGLDMECPWCV